MLIRLHAVDDMQSPSGCLQPYQCTENVQERCFDCKAEEDASHSMVTKSQAGKLKKFMLSCPTTEFAQASPADLEVR